MAPRRHNGGEVDMMELVVEEVMVVMLEVVVMVVALFLMVPVVREFKAVAAVVLGIV
jgi:hypothetical protein